MKPLFIENPIQVLNEIETLGLCRPGLLLAVDAVRLARNNCDDNDVPAARGLRGWMDGTWSLRNFYCPKGWEKNEDGNISSIFNRERQIKVMLSNTDDATGRDLEGRYPQNRNRKGPATDRQISMNQQIDFFEMFDSPNIVRLSMDQGGIQHWFLCVYHEGNAANGDVVRAELSLPSLCEGGYFTTFHKRIILIGDNAGGDDGSGIRVQPEAPSGDSGEFEITVTRKQA